MCSLLTISGPYRELMMEVHMDWNRVEVHSTEINGKVKEKFGKLTDDGFNVINCHREQLEGNIQRRCGLPKDQIRRDIDDWYSSQKWN